MKRSSLAGIVLVLIAVLISACTPGPTATPTAGPATPTAQQPAATPTVVAGPLKVKFGIATALTGTSAAVTMHHVWAQQANAQLINDAGGFTVKGQRYIWDIVVYDTQLLPAQAVTAVNKLIFDDKVNYILVGGGAAVIATRAINETNKVITFAYGLGDVLSPNAPHTFRFIMSDREASMMGYPYFIKQFGIKTVAYINADNDMGRAVDRNTKVNAEASGVRVVDSEFFQTGTTDFSAVATRLLAAKPDMIDTGGSTGSDVALIIKTVRELGFKGPIIIPVNDIPQVVATAGIANTNNVFQNPFPPIPTTSEANKFTEAFKKVSGRDPISFSYDCWWPLPVLTKAIVQAQTFDTDALTDTMANTPVESLWGPARFGGLSSYGIKRQMLFPVGIGEIVDGKAQLKVLFPVPEGL